MESEDIWEIAKFALNIVSENYKEEPWDCIIDNDERAIYEILNKYTKDKDEQNKIYGAFLHCQYLDCDKDIYGYVPKVINRLEKLGYKIIGGILSEKKINTSTIKDSIDYLELQRIVNNRIFDYVSKYHSYPKYVKLPLWIFDCLKQTMCEVDLKIDYKTEEFTFFNLKVCETVSIEKPEEIEVF